jgi:hypothetical protein
MTHNAQEVPVVELDDSPTAGLAERYQQLRDRGLPDQQIEALLEQDGEVGAQFGPASRGALGEWLRNTLAVLKGRRLIEEFGTVNVPIVWLVFDVPHQSRASLEWTVEGQQTTEFSLKLFGTGYGSRRTVSWSMSQGVAERDNAMSFIRDVVVDVKLYEVPRVGGQPRLEAEASVVGRGPARLLATAPAGRVAAAALDPFTYEVDPGAAVDLVKFDAPLEQTQVYRAERESSFSIGVEALKAVLPTGVAVEVGAKLSSKGACAVTWKFAPGFVHQPYWSRRQRGVLPLWSVVR